MLHHALATAEYILFSFYMDYHRIQTTRQKHGQKHTTNMYQRIFYWLLELIKTILFVRDRSIAGYVKYISEEFWLIKKHQYHTKSSFSQSKNVIISFVSIIIFNKTFHLFYSFELSHRLRVIKVLLLSSLTKPDHWTFILINSEKWV